MTYSEFWPCAVCSTCYYLLLGLFIALSCYTCPSRCWNESSASGNTQINITTALYVDIQRCGCVVLLLDCSVPYHFLNHFMMHASSEYSNPSMCVCVKVKEPIKTWDETRTPPAGTALKYTAVKLQYQDTIATCNLSLHNACSGLKRFD